MNKILSKTNLFPIEPYNNESLFLVIINSVILVNYASLNIMSMFRYFVNQTTYIPVLAIITFSLKVFPLILGLIKVFYYVKTNSRFSVISLIILIGSSVLFFYKYELNFANLLINWPDLLTAIYLIVALYGISLDTVCEIHLLSIGVPFSIRVILALLNIMPGSVSVTSYGHQYNDLGFGNHNAAMVMFLFISFALAYIVRNTQKQYLIIFIIIPITIILYISTYSKTSTIILAILILFLCFQAFFKYNTPLLNSYRIIQRKLFKLLAFSPTTSVLLTFCGLLVYNVIRLFCNNETIIEIMLSNTLLDRFNQFSMDCALHGVPLPFSYYPIASSEVEPFNYICGSFSKTRFADNLFHRIFINYGILLLLIFIVSIQFYAIIAYKRNFTMLLIILSLFSLFNVLESHGLLYNFNPFLLMPFTVLSKKPVQKQE